MLSPLLIFGFLFLWDTPATHASSHKQENKDVRRPLLRSLSNYNTTVAYTENVWKFVVLADVHGFTAFSYIDNPIDAPNNQEWSDYAPIVQNIKTKYGGEIIMMPGDIVSYGHQTTEQLKENYGHPDLTDNQAIYQMARNVGLNTRYFFDQNGWNGIPLLACIGDHEIGGNGGFFTGKRTKIPTIPDYRRGFKEGYYFKNEANTMVSSNPYWYETTVVNLSTPTPSTPVDTPYEGTSFAYVHKNALFVTVNAFEKISNSNYHDRENGTGGEGTVTCTVVGAHLNWFESVLSAAQADQGIQHIFVQAHVPIQQPVRKVKCSGQYFDLGVESPFWKAMEKYGVDVYFAGEVHSNTATQTSSSGPVQIVTRSNEFSGFLTIDVSKDVIDIKYMREEGDLPKLNNAYAEGGRLTIDKTGTLSTITSSGELEIHDLEKPIISFDFEQVHNLGDRGIVGLRGSDSLIATSVEIQGFTATESFHNKGVYGSHYDAPTHKVIPTPSGDARLGMAGLFDGSASQMAVFAWGPYSGGEPMSFSMWFKTERSNAEMVLFNYGTSWNSRKLGTNKDHFLLTLDNGKPTVRIHAGRSIKVSNEIINLADGQWHNVAVSMPRKSCLLSEVQIYIDMVREQTASQGSDLNIFTHTAGRISLGGVGYFNRAYVEAYPNLDPFTGLLDEFQLWAKPSLPSGYPYHNATCKDWCPKNSKPWIQKCTWTNCAGCDQCTANVTSPSDVPSAIPSALPSLSPSALPSACKDWCPKNSKPWIQKCTWTNCAGCDQCTGTMPQVIRDVTADLNPPSNFWDGDDMEHSFGIGSNHFPPTFTDWDGDGFLDFFFNNHIKADYAADFDLGVSRLENSFPEFQSIGFATFVDGDSEQMNHDCHGSTFADMDGDGMLDLVISVGGGRGAGTGKQNDNLLFWGETSDGDSRLVGGREAAVAAGVQCSNCRGRYMLVTDANQDGKLDVFPISDKRVDDIQTPTPLLLNNGDRTFTDHTSFSEFTRTILLTDADGDGYAQEYMVFRATCFRDPSEFDHSIWPHNEFCEVRPEKTTAIYKYDDQLGDMVLISPEYTRTLENQQYSPWNKEAAVDAVSGDFDFDQKADQIVLFGDKMVFYYSSDRSNGDLPLYNEDLNQVGSSEMNIPCSNRGVGLRGADLDMDGQMELLLLCSDLGEIYIYSHTGPKQWNLNTSWNLGDLTQTTGWKATPEQVALICDGTEVRDGYGSYFSKICKNPSYTPLFHGIQVVDLNNDGFLDFVVSSSIGKHRFFANEPLTVAQNRFLVFELKSTVSNVYAIGATLIFKASGLNPQLREISSFGFGNARSGGRDDRLVFGFGDSAMPQSLTVRWPSMVEKVYDLTSLDASHFSTYSNPVVITEPQVN